ncbi:MAG: hypothetical protein IPK56_11245 [Elusimicrobia bacterium]|nr:hypothetical protein [Elusimicrobiota bacterium]
MLERTHFLRPRGGYNLFLFDFRGHGESGPGRTSLSRYEIDDLRAALAHVRFEHPGKRRASAFLPCPWAAPWPCGRPPTSRPWPPSRPKARSPELGPTVLRYGRLFHHTPPLSGAWPFGSPANAWV